MTMTNEPPARPSASADAVGTWLVAHRWEIDRGELGWLEALADFDRAQGWVADGQLCCADWLMWRTKMARATAFEKLRIAHELRRRPLIRDAFADGRLSYSAVRVITRIDRPDPEVDSALIDLAEAGRVVDLERAVRVYERYQDQDRPPPSLLDRRGLHMYPRDDGTAVVEVMLEASEAEELAAALRLVMDHRPVDESPTGDAPGLPVDESPAGDNPVARLRDHQSWPEQRVDAFMDLVRAGMAQVQAGGGQAPGADRYLVHVVQRADGTALIDGTVLDPVAGERIACDASLVTHHLDDSGEPLWLGRKTREWSTAQRRAITVRDSGRCRFPGCHHRFVDIHHLRPWTEGGPTDVDNGLLICPRHHTLLHRGFSAKGKANGAVAFFRPAGMPLGSTAPYQCMAPPAEGRRRGDSNRLILQADQRFDESFKSTDVPEEHGLLSPKIGHLVRQALELRSRHDTVGDR
jgi:hypothetical protein